MKKADTRYGLLGLTAAALAYILAMWGLLLLLFFVYKEVPSLQWFNVLSWETMFTLALGSLLPVFGAEQLLYRRIAMPWILVRLAAPCVGFILFLATLIGFFPVLLQNMFILFPTVWFMLIQGGILLFSICFTAIFRYVRRSRARSKEPDIVSDPKLRPITLPPETKLTAPPSAPQDAPPRKRDWKKNVSAAVIVAAMIGSMAAMLVWFPSYQTALLFWPAVTQADVSVPGHWVGRRPAEDIPRLTGLSQLEDHTYDSLTYLTVETDHLIPLSYYKIKDFSESRLSGSNGYAQAKYHRTPLPVYTHFAGVNAMYYGQYYVVELEDGSCIGAYMDSSYSTALGKVTLPIGQVTDTSQLESDLLAEAAGDYSVPTDRMLMMHGDRFYSKMKLLDQCIRLLAVVLAPALVFGGSLSILFIWKKRRHG